MARFCSVCGKELGDNETFCTNCGANNAQPTQTQYAPTGNPYPGNTYSAGSYPGYAASAYPQQSTRGRGLAIPSLILGIIGLIFDFIAFVVAMTGVEVSYYLDDEERVALIFTVLFLSIFSILALIFAIIAKKRGYSSGLQKGGFITSVIGLSIVGIAILSVLTA